MGQPMTAVRLLFACALLLSPSVSHAVTYRLLVEGKTRAEGGLLNELRILVFSTYEDFVTGNSSLQKQLDWTLGPEYDLGGFAYDANGYHLLVEGKTPAEGGLLNELRILEFSTYEDLVTGDFSLQKQLDWSLGAEYDLGGFDYDEDGYHLLVEGKTRAEGGLRNELRILDFPTYADLVAGNFSLQKELDWALGAEYDLGGFDYDDDGYHLLVEGKTRAEGGLRNELRILDFPTHADFVAGNFSLQKELDWALGAEYNLGGFAISRERVVPTPGVPEPTTWLMMLVGFAAIGWSARRRCADPAAQVDRIQRRSVQLAAGPLSGSPR